MKDATAFLSSSPAETLERLCYFLLLLFLPTQLGKHFWPDYALVAGFRVDYLSPTLYVTDILVLLLFLFRLRQLAQVRLSALLPYLLFLLFLLLTILPAVSFAAGLYSLLKVTELLFFAWYTSRILAAPLLERLARAVMATTVLAEGLLALAQVSAKGSLGGMFYWLGERSISSMTPGAATTVLNGEVLLRPYATFSHPNVLAGFLLLGMSYVLLGDTFTPRSPVGSPSPFVWLRWGSLIVGTLGLLSTLSRVPILLWGLLLVGYFLTYVVRRSRTNRLDNAGMRRLLPFVITALVSAVVLLPLFSLVFLRFAQSSVTEESLLVRADLARIAWQLIVANPLLGVGLGNFLLASARLRSAGMPLFLAVQPVHNLWLLITAETGLLGLFLAGWFFLRSFRHAAPAVRILLLLLFSLGMVDHYLLTIQQGQLLLAFFLGLSWSSPPRRLSDYPQK